MWKTRALAFAHTYKSDLAPHLLFCIRQWSHLIETRLTVTSLLLSKVLSWRWPYLQLQLFFCSVALILLIFILSWCIFLILPWDGYNKITYSPMPAYADLECWSIIVYMYLGFVVLYLITFTSRNLCYCHRWRDSLQLEVFDDFVYLNVAWPLLYLVGLYFGSLPKILCMLFGILV